jgi:hypothetical protein
MKRRTSHWTIRLTAAVFGVALLFAAGPSPFGGGAAYAKSDKQSKETKSEAAKPTPKLSLSRPAPKAADTRPSSTSRDTSGPSAGRQILDFARSRVQAPVSNSRPTTTPAPAPRAPEIRRPDPSPARTTPSPPSSERQGSLSLRRPDPPPATTPERPTAREPSPPTGDRGLLPGLSSGSRDSDHSPALPIARPTPINPGGSGDTGRERTAPTSPGLSLRQPAPRTGPDESGQDRGPLARPSPEARPSAPPTRQDDGNRSGGLVLRPDPQCTAPTQPVVVPRDQERTIARPSTPVQRQGDGGRQIAFRSFERRDLPKVDDARRPLSPVPGRDSYFRGIRNQHPAVVARPLDISYFTALHRQQARHYYRAYYYQSAPYYYPYDLWYSDYYVNYYYPAYYARPYVVITLPVFIERYHTVYDCSQCNDGVWYYYDRYDEGYDGKYPYLTNYPGTLGKALRDIQRAWYDEDLNPLIQHVDDRDPIRIYRGDRHTHDLDPSEFLDLTLDAFDQTETDYLRYTEIRPSSDGGSARADAKHVFWDADGNQHTVYLSFRLERTDEHYQGDWVLREVRQDSQPF